MPILRLLQAIILFALFGIESAAYSQQITWRVASGTSGEWIAAVDLYATNPDSMFALTNRRLLRSTNRGENWDSVGYVNTTFGAIGIDPRDMRVLYVAIEGLTVPPSNDIYLSTDGGSKWNGPLFIGFVYVVRVIEFDPVEQGIVYVGVGPSLLYRSSDIGQTWDSLTSLPGLLSSLSIARSNNNILYAGYLRGVSKSTDRGNTWTALSLGFQPSDAVFVAVDPRDENVVYAAVWSNGASPGGMYKTTDGGAVWNEINNGIAAQHRWAQALTINPKNPDEILLGIYSTDHIVLRTTNGGATWNDFADGMLLPGRVNSIVFDTLNNRVYAGASSGLYIHETLTSISPDPKLIEHFALFQNYPNPFNPSTTIQYSIPKGGIVSLVIYDVLGRQVAVLESGIKSAGSHSVNFDASSLASGVYMYRLQAEEFNVIKKMLVVK